MKTPQAHSANDQAAIDLGQDLMNVKQLTLRDKFESAVEAFGWTPNGRPDRLTVARILTNEVNPSNADQARVNKILGQWIWSARS